MRICYLVITTASYHDSRALALWETWGSEVRESLRIFSDGPGSLHEIVALNVPSTYEGAPLKTVEAILWLKDSEFKDYDWFYVCDDDTYLYTNNFKRFLSDKDPNEDKFYGYPCANEEHGDLVWPSGGAGYAFGRGVLEKLFRLLPYQRLYSHSDLTLGYAFARLGINMVWVPGFYHKQPEELILDGVRQGAPSDQVLVRSPISFHYITPSRMRHFYHNRAAFEGGTGPYTDHDFTRQLTGEALELLIPRGFEVSLAAREHKVA